MSAIEACRTAALGGHESYCLDCGHQDISYNSCRNRHCPKCQSLSQAKWIEDRVARVLPVTHYHSVFTLPDSLRRLVQTNQAALYALLMRSASETLLDFGHDPKWIGGTIGVTTVLHTWTRDLRYHPHVHCIVTAGGLSSDGEWRQPKQPSFLFPVRAMGEVFRGKFLSGLERLKPDLNLSGIENFDRVKKQSAKKRWVVYAKQPFQGAKHVFEYLGRYTHRIGISNHRLISVDADGVRFSTKDSGEASVTPEEFIRRFLMHVLPKGFVKIRHYGLLASQNVNTKLALAQKLLSGQIDEAPKGAAISECPSTKVSWQERLKKLTGIDADACRSCGGKVFRIKRSAKELLIMDSTGPPKTLASDARCA